MAWGRALVLALLWPLQASAVVTWDELHALVQVGDVAPVEAALQAAVDADKVAAVEPDEQRKLFTLFTITEPEVEDFLDRWRNERPQSALAMTAMGWHLWKRGWNARGEATVDMVYPDAMKVFMDDHTQAYDLAVKAVAADPALLAASDLMLRLTATFGNFEVVPGELERVMTRHPNRGSLIRVMKSLAPQWGGSPAQVKLLCERYAPMVKVVPGYDAQVCAMDAVYAGGVWGGDQRDEAHQLLQLTPNPVLDYARLDDALAGLGSPLQRVKLLEGIKSLRALTLAEASALDNARAEIAGGLNTQDEWKLALAPAVEVLRKDADADPYDPIAVTSYVAVRQDAADNLGMDLQADDLIRRLQHLLARVPYSGRAWRSLADLTSRDVPVGKVDLDMMARVEPYYINAVVYSNYDPDMLASLVWGKYWAIMDPTNILKTRDITGLSVADRQRLDEVVHCPMLRQMTIMNVVCHNHGQDLASCSGFPADPEMILNQLREVVFQGSCHAEAEINRDPAALAYSPIKITFPPAP